MQIQRKTDQDTPDSIKRYTASFDPVRGCIKVHPIHTRDFNECLQVRTRLNRCNTYSSQLL